MTCSPAWGQSLINPNPAEVWFTKANLKGVVFSNNLEHLPQLKLRPHYRDQPRHGGPDCFKAQSVCEEAQIQLWIRPMLQPHGDIEINGQDWPRLFLRPIFNQDWGTPSPRLKYNTLRSQVRSLTSTSSSLVITDFGIKVDPESKVHNTYHWKQGTEHLLLIMAFHQFLNHRNPLPKNIKT